jgi:hypothetical protein
MYICFAAVSGRSVEGRGGTMSNLVSYECETADENEEDD